MNISLSPAEDAGFGCVPSPSGSGEMILSTDGKAIISFLGCDDSQESYKDLGRVAVVCDRVLAMKNGYPNDEPRSWIPRFTDICSMTKYIPVARILNDDWAKQLSKDNEHKFPESDYINADLKHYVFLFKESTTEVLCQECRVETNLDYESLFEFAQKEFYG